VYEGASEINSIGETEKAQYGRERTNEYAHVYVLVRFTPVMVRESGC